MGIAVALDGAVTYAQLRDMPLPELDMVREEAERIIAERKRAARAARGGRGQ